MGKPLIVVGSITFAMKGRDVLGHKGIRASVERVPHHSDTRGCGYGLYVPERTDEAERILRAAGVPVTGREPWGVDGR